MPAKQVNINKFIGNHLTSVLRKAPRAIGVIGEKHFKQSFRLQRFNDYNSKPWESTKDGKSRNILIGKQSGALRNSIQTERADLQQIKWVARRPYARIHNEGGTTYPKVTPQMRKYAWARYYAAAGKGVKTSKSGAQYQSISVGKEANKWKGLALTKKTSLTVRIKQRKYMGRSRAMEDSVNDWMTKNLDYRK